MAKRKTRISGQPYVDNMTPVDGGRATRTVETISEGRGRKELEQIEALLNEQDAFSHNLGSIFQLGDNNQLLQQLLQLAYGNLGKNGSAYGDIQKLLLEMALKQLTANEQRNYDASVLGEQRLYDSPTNQLSRLIGAGISRDAAIQMLQGGQDAALVGSGADSTIPSELPSPSEKLMQGLQVGASLLGTIGSLVSLGFSIPQAIQQSHFLKNQNILSDSQLKGYNSAAKAFNILNAAGSATKAFSSATSAAAEIKRLADGGNSDALAFMSAPDGYQQLVNNAPFSSPALANMYKSEHSSELFRKEMRRADLENTLTNAKAEEVFQNIHESVARVRKINAEADQVYQDLQRGAIEIEIAGKALVIADATAKQFQLESDALDIALGMRDSQGRDLPHLVGMKQFMDMWEQFQESAVNYDDGERFINFLENNRDAAFTAAYMAYLAQQDMSESMDEENDSPSIWSNLMRFYNMIHNAGISSEVQQSSSTASKIGVELIKLFVTKKP